MRNIRFSPFRLQVVGEGPDRRIFFRNESPDHVEVIFLIDGLSAKDGTPPSKSTRGFGLHPNEERELTRRPSKQPLAFGEHGTVEAIVYKGSSLPLQDALDIPPFVRRKTQTKMRFRRFSDTPSYRITVRY